MASTDHKDDSQGSSPVGRGGAGVYIEGELGAFYLLSMLAGSEARGLPGNRLTKVQFQAVDEGFELDDLVLHGTSAQGSSVLEIQSKRTITFAPKDKVFEKVCGQVARSKSLPSIVEARHGLAVATQRTSARISGPYQDVIGWARSADNAAKFFERLDAKGVASPEMRNFVTTFRNHLVSAGVADEEEAIWRLLRRFQILEFDFEASSPLARTYALNLARAVLSPEDACRADGLVSALIEMSLAAGKVGAGYDLPSLEAALVTKGFKLAGKRDFSLAREKLAEMARHALANIDATVAGVHLLREEATRAFDDARDAHRFVELSGKPGVGKSAFLKRAADRINRQSHVLVLDPIGTPEGGWAVLAAQLGVKSTAKAFLSDLAVSGGGVLFIDSLEMFTSEARRRTVNDVLREVSSIDGFSVIATARADFGQDGDDWLALDAVAAIGPRGRVEIPDLTDADVDVLRAQAPELRAILAPGHPAAAISRNLYRLTRLLKAPPTTSIHTEAALASHWWDTGSDSKPSVIRPAQRLLAEVADAALGGDQTLLTTEDGPARSGLLASLTLRETQRDHLTFYHDVLRDWAVGKRLTEAPVLLASTDRARPAPQTLARGIEFAGRFLLEDGDTDGWRRLLDSLSADGAHSSWRRHALMAILRSEVADELLRRESRVLAQNQGQLLTELIAAVVAIETTPTADLFANLKEAGLAVASAPSTLRTATGPAGPKLLLWCIQNVSAIPLQALPAVLKLIMVHFVMIAGYPELGRSVAKILLGWLLQLDVRGVKPRLPGGAARGADDLIRQIVPDLRILALTLAGGAPDETKAYLGAVAKERDTYKANGVRDVSTNLAKVLPRELSEVIESSLIAPRKARPEWDRSRRDPFTFADSNYMPASPAQRPFLDLLQNSKEIGLQLIRKLAAHAVEFDSPDPDFDDGFTIVFEAGPRFFRNRGSYEWSRGRSNDDAVASGLMALEAWGHLRLDAGEPIADVLVDVLGPEGTCAAFVLVAVDLILSHWPASRAAATPFVSCPELLVADRTRVSSIGGFVFALKEEPAGKVRLEDLRARPSRRVSMEQLLPFYASGDQASERVRGLLTAAVAVLGPYDDRASFGDPEFMGARALNVVSVENWQNTDAGRAYISPPAEADHLALLEKRSAAFTGPLVLETRIDRAVEGGQHATSELARQAAEYAAGDLPDDSDTDYLKTRSTRLVKIALLVARDGDDELLTRQEGWVRSAIDWALGEEPERGESRRKLEFSQPALATLALAHLWRRRAAQADRNRLLEVAVRRDGAGFAGFEAAIDALAAVDPRLAKSIVRAAVSTARWRYRGYDEDEAAKQEVLAQDAAYRAQIADAEVAWLNGGDEPAWARFAPRPLSIRRGISLSQFLSDDRRSDEDEDIQETVEEDAAGFETDADGAAKWLGLAVGAKHVTIGAWLPEVVAAYADWTARANGLGLEPAAEIEHPPSSWNSVFYELAASVLLEGSDSDFDAAVDAITAMPDKSFASVSATFLYAADVWYFNTAGHPADRAVKLREKLVTRTLALRHWNQAPPPGAHSFNRDTSPIVGTILMNSVSAFTETRSYLKPALFDRIDPLLEPLGPLLKGGPVALIALCVVNTLSVHPSARHAEFLISGAELWQSRLPTDTALWVDLGIGRRIVSWLREATVESPELNGRDHPLRLRIDAMLGRLVAVGVAEAHDLERTIQSEQARN